MKVTMPDPIEALADLSRADARVRALASWRHADAVALTDRAAETLARGELAFLGDEDDEERPGYEIVDGVAVVTICGALMDRACWWWDGYDAIADRVAKAHADRTVRAVMLDVQSPGGMVAGLFDCMAALRDAKTASSKRTVAWVADGAYSAAYGLASTADEIVCGELAGTGSVGVITSMCSLAKRVAAEGVDVRVIASGVEKTDGHPYVEISPEAEARVTARVASLAGAFASRVAQGRPLDATALLALDGGVRYGLAAVAAGLADRVGTRAALLAELSAQPAKTAPRVGAQRTASAGATTKRITMDESQAAELAALTSTTDPAAQLAAVKALRDRVAAAEQSAATALATVDGLSRDLATANARAAEAQARVDASERTSEMEGARAEGKLTASLEGFLGSLSVEQVRAWRSNAPVVIPRGEIKPPADSGEGSTGSLPADVAAAVAKAQSQGWAALSPTEKHAVTAHSAALSTRLRNV